MKIRNLDILCISMDFKKPKSNPSHEKLFLLWNSVHSIVYDASYEDSRRTEEHENRIRRHYAQLLSNLNVPDVVAQMFTIGKLTSKENEHLRQFHATPIRASEELLNIVIINSQDVYECFLESLKKTKQHHLYQMLTSDEAGVHTGKHFVSEHSRLIRQNYDWLIESIDSDSGLLNNLYAKEVLNQREYCQVVSERHQFVKNEMLLSIISRKSTEEFQNFKISLKDTSQEHVANRFTETPVGDANETVAPSVEKKIPNASSESLGRRISRRLEPRPKSIQQTPTPSPSKPLVIRPKPLIEPQSNPAKPSRLETRSNVKEYEAMQKKSVECLEKKFNQLPIELQTEVSTKLFLIHRSSPKDSIWRICFTKLLQESRNIKRQNTMQTKVAEEHCERLMQETIQRERQCKKMKEDMQQEKTKAQAQRRELQERLYELEDSLNVTKAENGNLLGKLKKSEAEVESLKVLLNKRQEQETNEKASVFERLEGEATHYGIKLKEMDTQLRDTKDQLIRKDLALKAATTKLIELEKMLQETETKQTEFEAKEIVSGTDDGMTLVNLKQMWAEERKQLKQDAKELQQRLLDSMEKCMDLEEELEQERLQKDRLREQMQEREGTKDEHHERYKSHPVLIQTIRTKSGGKRKLHQRAKASAEKVRKSIRGLTILDKELYVVSERSSEVEVYDAMKFSYSRRWDLKELIRPMDIGSCRMNKCLYIFDCKGTLHSNEILRIHPTGKLIKNWLAGVELGYGLSVTGEGNVILTDYNKSKLNEYSPDGQVISEINLLSCDDIRWPWHAVKLTNGHFVVSHGSIVEDLHRVCIVDSDGNIRKSFGGKCGAAVGQMNRPVHLSVDGNGFVMVADQINGRILLLDSNLEYKREILSKDEKHGLHDPWNIILDESNGRLFVADNESDNQRILIFDFK